VRAPRLVRSLHANRLASLAAVLASWPGFVPVARQSEFAASLALPLAKNRLARSQLVPLAGDYSVI